jgi:hypothetical protein
MQHPRNNTFFCYIVWLLFLAIRLKNLFCHFLNYWGLRVSGMGGYAQKFEKCPNHCTLLCALNHQNCIHADAVLSWPEAYSLNIGENEAEF